MNTPFDLLKARIAQSLLPEGYIVKGRQAKPIGSKSPSGYVKNEKGEWVKPPKGHAERQKREEELLSKIDFKKTPKVSVKVKSEMNQDDIMRKLDMISERMGEIEEMYRQDKFLPRHESEYKELDRKYNAMHNRYKLKEKESVLHGKYHNLKLSTPNPNTEVWREDEDKMAASDEHDIEKGRQAMPVGTISHGRKKQADGSWTPIKEGKKKTFEEDYKEIKNFFLTFGEKKKKIDILLNKANAHAVSMGIKLADSVADGTITVEKFVQMQQDYSSHLKKVVEISKKFQGSKFDGIIRVLSQGKIGVKQLPNYGLSYGTSITKLYKKGETNSNKHWPASKVQHVMEGVTSIVGEKRMNYFQKNPEEVILLHKKMGDKYTSNIPKGESVLSPMIKIKGKIRAYCRWQGDHGRVVISSYDSAATLAHELGHYVEDTNPDIKEKAIAYVKARTKGEKLTSMNEAKGTKSYGMGEYCKPDKFIEPYTGKMYFAQNYKHIPRATELVSMWFTHVFQNPQRFIQKDEDHFKTVLKWFRE